MEKKLEELLIAARGRTMTAKEEEEQRVNFAFGNAPADDHNSTIETVRAASAILKAK